MKSISAYWFAVLPDPAFMFCGDGKRIPKVLLKLTENPIPDKGRNAQPYVPLVNVTSMLELQSRPLSAGPTGQ